MKPMRTHRRSRAFHAALAIALCATWAHLPARAESTQDEPALHGEIQSRTPIELSSGFLKMGKSAGFAYIVNLMPSGGDLRIESDDNSLLPGDCVWVTGTGKKTKLERAQHSVCAAPTASKAPTGDGTASTSGDGGPSCAEARREVRGWPPGPERRRALRMELEACANEPLGTGSTTDDGTTSSDGPSDACRAAWQKVGELPFGPARAEARRNAFATCSSDA